jgi:alpha-tubulin suppressor-like RCC1 family protein
MIISSFSGSGNVYVWGSGSDGQLGLGNTVTFQSTPKKLRHSELKNSVVQIGAGECYSAALTGRALTPGKYRAGGG